MKKEVTYLKASDLTLDINNPRFGELYTGSNKEEELIEYLLFNESALSLVDRLAVTKEFYVDKPLLVLQDGKRNIVKDGNRRCAAVKALAEPKKYGVNQTAYDFPSLPVVVYTDKQEIENRIREEHTNSGYREWDRIAKAIEVHRQFQGGSSIESMQEIDSKPTDLIKLASFYYEAVKIGGDDLRKLLRKGRGDTGGKTTIFERLFKHASSCGYRFKNKPDYVVEITDKKRFRSYITSIVKYLNKNPGTTYRDVDDNNKELFDAIGLSELAKPNGNISEPVKKPNAKIVITQATPIASVGQSKHTNKSQQKPQYNRTIPVPLKKVIDECYDLSELNFTNSKIAMTRVVFECCLKYVVEETKYNGKLLKDYSYFDDAFRHGRGPWTNVKRLKELFQELVSNTGKKQAFKSFDLETPHQIIHNYNVAGLIKDCKSLCANLIPLIEFMLESETNLLNNLATNKL